MRHRMNVYFAPVPLTLERDLKHPKHPGSESHVPNAAHCSRKRPHRACRLLRRQTRRQCSCPNLKTTPNVNAFTYIAVFAPKQRRCSINPCRLRLNKPSRPKIPNESLLIVANLSSKRDHQWHRRSF
jgi:hypothetical protein